MLDLACNVRDGSVFVLPMTGGSYGLWHIAAGAAIALSALSSIILIMIRRRRGRRLQELYRDIRNMLP